MSSVSLLCLSVSPWWEGWLQSQYHVINPYSSWMVSCALKDQIHPCSPMKVQEGPISTEMVLGVTGTKVPALDFLLDSHPFQAQILTWPASGVHSGTCWSVLTEPGNHLPFGHNGKPACGKETCNMTCFIISPSGLKRNFREHQNEIYSLWESQNLPHICRRPRGSLESCLIPAEENPHNTPYGT